MFDEAANAANDVLIFVLVYSCFVLGSLFFVVVILYLILLKTSSLIKKNENLIKFKGN